MIGSRIGDMLISKDVDVPRKETTQRQLFDAIEAGDCRLLSCLIGIDGMTGADLDQCNNEENDTLLACAVRRGDADMVDVLLKAGSSVDHTGQRGWTALHLAIHDGRPCIARLLLARGADASARVEHGSEMGMNALHLAAAGGHAEIVMALLESGVDALLTVEKGPCEGWNALHLCAASGCVEAIDTLLRAGVMLEAIVRTGKSQGLRALHIAALNDRAAVATALIKAGCDIAAVVPVNYFSGCNALHLAASKNFGSVIDVLLDAGAKIDAPIEAGSYKGWDALCIAVWNGHADLICRLCKAGIDCNPGMRVAIASCNWNLASKLVRRLPFDALPSLDLTPVFTEPPLSGNFAVREYKICQQRLAQIVGVRYLDEIEQNAGTETEQQCKDLFVARLTCALRSMNKPDRARVLASIAFASTMHGNIPPHAPTMYLLFLLDDLDATQRDGMRKDILEKIRMLDQGRVQVDSDGRIDGFVQILATRDKTSWVPWLTRQLLRQLGYSCSGQDDK